MVLRLGNNEFVGSIPTTVGRLHNIQGLYLSGNKLQGQIPESICYLKKLDTLSVRENELGGPIPSCFKEDFLDLAMRNRISFDELLNATDGYNECNLLGSGSFGLVYKGVLSNGIDVAVKVFNLQLEGALQSFDVECEVLRNIRHRNLIKVISTCSNMDFKALVLEFMPNGSLERWLYSHNYFLDIMQRLNIILDVASALEYLHHGHPMPIVHCDLKPSNVLLDKDLVAHVSDFGIAKLLSEESSLRQTMTPATIGYMAYFSAL